MVKNRLPINKRKISSDEHSVDEPNVNEEEEVSIVYQLKIFFFKY